MPLAYVGKWIDWSADGMRIIAVAKELSDAHRLAAEAGEPEPMMERVMPPNRL